MLASIATGGLTGLAGPPGWQTCACNAGGLGSDYIFRGLNGCMRAPHHQPLRLHCNRACKCCPLQCHRCAAWRWPALSPQCEDCITLSSTSLQTWMTSGPASIHCSCTLFFQALQRAGPHWRLYLEASNLLHPAAWPSHVGPSTKNFAFTSSQSSQVASSSSPRQFYTPGHCEFLCRP